MGGYVCVCMCVESLKRLRFNIRKLDVHMQERLISVSWSLCLNVVAILFSYFGFRVKFGKKKIHIFNGNSDRANKIHRVLYFYPLRVMEVPEDKTVTESGAETGGRG